MTLSPSLRISMNAFSNPPPDHRSRRCGQGFTLIEVLVAVAIIAVLATVAVGISAVALAKAREAREVSAMRNLLTAYQAHNAEQGKLVSMLDGSPLFRNDGTRVPSFMAYRYPMRLGPYLGWSFVGSVLVNAAEARSKDLYGVSVFPSFGYNGAYLGGDPSLPLDGVITTADDTALDVPPLAFASSRHDDYSNYETLELASDVQREGFYRLIPSFRWSSAPYAANGNADKWGHVDFRHRGRCVAGFLDGRVESMTEARLREESLWSGRIER